MNIFAVDEDPVVSAQSLVDKHVRKMILESCQILSTAHRVLDGDMYIGKTRTGRNVKRWRLPDARETTLYSATHVNHPSTKWAMHCDQNYMWLYEHLKALCEEYTYRYEKVHKTDATGLVNALIVLPNNIRYGDMTPVTPAMDDKYIVSDSFVDNYRNYYKVGKKHLHAWKKRNPPDWLTL